LIQLVYFKLDYSEEDKAAKSMFINWESERLSTDIKRRPPGPTNLRRTPGESARIGESLRPVLSFLRFE
jgi:hypothetical protein